MQYAVFTQDPADRPSPGGIGARPVPGGIGARPVQDRWTIERGAIQMPKHQLLFPVGEAKGPCEVEVHPLERFVPCNNPVQLSLVSLQADGRAVAHLIGNIFRIDARRVAAQNHTMDVLRTDGRPLAFFRGTGAFQYSDVGMFVLTEFFAAKTNFAALSPII